MTTATKTQPKHNPNTTQTQPKPSVTNTNRNQNQNPNQTHGRLEFTFAFKIEIAHTAANLRASALVHESACPQRCQCCCVARCAASCNTTARVLQRVLDDAPRPFACCCSQCTARRQVGAHSKRANKGTKKGGCHVEPCALHITLCRAVACSHVSNGPTRPGATPVCAQR
jgi:hypothetical protein